MLALASLGSGFDPGEVAMVGDDVRNDVTAAQAVGMRGVLVRTGKFRPGDENVLGDGATVIDSVADVPGLLG
jgi:ribonucleotide monophosphatase NagD (HAD superfamily)